MAKKPAPAKKAAAKKGKAGTSKESAAMRKKLFVEAFLTNGENAGKAATAAGFSPKTADQAGSRLLRDVQVQAWIKERRAALVEKFELTTERTLREIARLAYCDPRKFFHPDGTPKQIHELDDDTAAALAGMEVTEEFEGSGQDRKFIGFTKKYKLADKNAALEKAMKHLGEYEADNKQRNPIREMSEEQLQRFVERKAKEAGVTLH
jgi:phage terminase small subunit